MTNPLIKEIADKLLEHKEDRNKMEQVLEEYLGPCLETQKHVHTTADGVPLKQGMELWERLEDGMARQIGTLHSIRTQYEDVEISRPAIQIVYELEEVKKFYSSREKAQNE